MRYTLRMAKWKKPTNEHEHRLRKAGHRHIAGVDEVGKGSWAGPLVAAAVILDTNDVPAGVTDSKLLSPKQREELFVAITKKAIAWAVHIVPAAVIDKEGITEANRQALERATAKLYIKPDALLVDAFPLTFTNIPVVSIIDGDALERTIGAASIVAKVVRDRIMSSELHRLYPLFQFHIHKGYGTALHQQLLTLHGPTPEHRKSFAPVKARLGLKVKKQKTKVKPKKKTGARVKRKVVKKKVIAKPKPRKALPKRKLAKGKPRITKARRVTPKKVSRKRRSSKR
jgi:ribonuclease HII